MSESLLGGLMHSIANAHRHRAQIAGHNWNCLCKSCLDAKWDMAQAQIQLERNATTALNEDVNQAMQRA